MVIEGLKEIKANKWAIAAWHEEFQRQMESEDGILSMPRKPVDRSAELAAKYPRAMAYLKAESVANKRNFELSAIGRKACKRIEAGEDYEKVLADMEQEREDFANRHMWD